MEAPKLTGLKKRQQIQSANKTMFMWIVAASAAIAVCAVLGQFMVRQFLFNSKVIEAKATAQRTLDNNLDSVDGLKEEVNRLVANDQLTKLRVAESDTALQVIIDALPTDDDRAALATSLQQIVLARSGVTIDTIGVTDSVAGVDPSGLAAPVAATAGPVEISFSFSVSGDYAKISQAIADVEKSIRPITIQTLNIEGSGNQLQATVGAKTYYLPAKTVQLQSRVVTP